MVDICGQCVLPQSIRSISIQPGTSHSGSDGLLEISCRISVSLFFHSKSEVWQQIPPDVKFRDAAFEIKEVLDEGRKRHDEYRDHLRRAWAARSPEELLEPYHPRCIYL